MFNFVMHNVMHVMPVSLIILFELNKKKKKIKIYKISCHIIREIKVKTLR